MSLYFNNKTIWITGASSGIGEALAKALAAQGAFLILSGRRVEALQGVAAQMGDRGLVLPFEVTEFDALPELVAQAWAWRGGVDILVNNAGISQRSLALDTELAVYRRLMDVDFLAPVALTQLVLPRMVGRGSGHIAIISSVAGKVGVPLRTGYCAAKHACVGYFDAIRAEIETAYGIAVSVILPGSVQTSIAVNALTADGAARGRSDANIDAGMDVTRAATIILDGLAQRAREIVVAEGAELGAMMLRTQNPDMLFAMLAEQGARLAALRKEHGADVEPEPVGIDSRALR